MSDSVWPHRLQPTRLPRPWDSPGKNTGVGCHFLLQCMKVKSESEVPQSYPTLNDPMDCSLTGSSVHGIFQARVLEWGAIAFSATYRKSLKIYCRIKKTEVENSLHYLFTIKTAVIMCTHLYGHMERLLKNWYHWFLLGRDSLVLRVFKKNTCFSLYRCHFSNNKESIKYNTKNDNKWNLKLTVRW